MDPIVVAERYFAGWNAHDGDAIAATFAAGGTYTDPTVSGLDGPATGAAAVELAASFPDLHFEIVSVDATDDGLVAAQWIMRGKNSGSYHGLPPTGREIAMPGSDFIRVGADGIESIDGYFDSGLVPRQLGLDVIVQPRTAGPFEFGTSVRVSGGSAKAPGAFGLTCLEARTPAEREQVRTLTRAIATQMLEMPGFIALLTATIGDRMYTMTAWESIEASRQLMKSTTHREAARSFFGPGLASGGQTGVWTVDHVNGQLRRCDTCGKMTRAAETCACGAALPEPPAWW
jgi:steroid delta-isomerase-like uncharacterized protein